MTTEHTIRDWASGTVIIRWLVAGMLIALAVALLSCGKQPASDKGKSLPVSETPPKVESLRKPERVLANTSVPSKGECAPRYANGQIGTCINNLPCRGLGMLDPNGKAICSCFGEEGGCEAGLRCDGLMKSCVPENEPTLGRAPARAP